jgi:AcrR family transcriptional regulator
MMATPVRRRAPRGAGEELRPRIVAAAKELMAAATAEEVSIRAVAAAVGVTPPSIYLHFEDKRALITAVVIDVFEELDQLMLAAVADVTDPLERLRCYGLTYVRFALDHPEHYRLATMDASPRPDVDQLLAASAFVHLRDAAVACMEAGVFAPAEPIAVTLDLWAAAHGVAALLVAKPYLPYGDPMAYADRVLCAAAYGHTVAPDTWPSPGPAEGGDGRMGG